MSSRENGMNGFILFIDLGLYISPSGGGCYEWLYSAETTI